MSMFWIWFLVLTLWSYPANCSPALIRGQSESVPELD
uniref:Uncharacterized protein n=1 Tax=Anguilla anguilla TaxID=7936 RepID=A0A0E9SV75_ANGAN